LKELIGSVAGKLHTGRSRNDQVATDMRLWLRSAIERQVGLIKSLISVGVERAAAEIDYLMPGFTHLQRAQPVRWSHWLLSHCAAWRRDVERFEQTLARTDVCPLGSGALAGNPFGVDRSRIAADLGFAGGATLNSLDSVSDRDFIADYLYASAMLGVHLSRFAEDLIVYSTASFDFIELSDAYSTGSSLMPQKKNADSLELLRGKSSRFIGNLNTMIVCLKGLPTTYNKDLQEDKEAMFDTADTLEAVVQIAAGVLSTLKVHEQKMRDALSADMLATDLAEYLVRKGVPFRDTHHIAGAAVKMAEDRQCQLSDLSADDLRTLHDQFADDVVDIWNFEQSVERRSTLGGTSRSAVLQQIDRLRKLCN
jgi:argininosuccinate lyase